MNIYNWLFPPSVTRYDQLIMVSPDPALLRDVADTLGQHEHVSLHLSCKVNINGHSIHMAQDELAFVLMRRRWWSRKPAITVALLNNEITKS